MLAVISGFSYLGAPAAMLENPAAAPPIEETAVSEVKPPTTKEKVVEYFSDLPIMVEIARCESHFRQTGVNGEIHRGKVNRFDVGVMQINELYHLERAERLGFDIHSLGGNLAYARYLYEREGTRPWLSSSPCWAKFNEIARK
ncbi:hypothetical protein EPN83_02225 [Patescibacteria group bacterium]|nr:MAG: hypothetical protein EPN83_02225 [Patescibacteria group bacterium]